MGAPRPMPLETLAPILSSLVGDNRLDSVWQCQPHLRNLGGNARCRGDNALSNFLFFVVVPNGRQLGNLFHPGQCQAENEVAVHAAGCKSSIAILQEANGTLPGRQSKIDGRAIFDSALDNVCNRP